MITNSNTLKELVSSQSNDYTSIELLYKKTTGKEFESKMEKLIDEMIKLGKEYQKKSSL